MGGEGKTRLANRIKKFGTSFKKVDADKRRSIHQDKLNYLESDYYEEPNKMAEDKDSDGFELEEEEKPLKPREKIQRRIQRKIKKDTYLRKNFNLMKIIRDEDLMNKKEINFCNITVRPSNIPARKFCSICGSTSHSSCPRCGERICKQRCWRLHIEVKCLNFEMQF